MSLYNIAFDTNNKTECLNHFSIEKKKDFILLIIYKIHFNHKKIY